MTPVAIADRMDVRQAVVLSLAYQWGNPNRPAVEREYDQVKAENDWTSEQVARFPDRLRGFCSVNPLKTYALEEIARCATDPRLRTGLELHFGNSDVDLESAAHVERLRAVFGAANAHRMAIVVHMRSTVSRKRPYGAASARAFLDRVLPAAPDVPVQIAARLRAIGVERILYGSDGAGGGNPTPAEAWAAFRQLPLSDAELRTIAANVAPYLR